MPSRSRLVDDLACNDCGSTVTAADRFCPACGTPNAHTKFHPKFGPELVRFEPRIVEDVAEPGAPSCPRCHRTMEQHDYCRACGMELGANQGVRQWVFSSRSEKSASDSTTTSGPYA